MSDVNRNIKRLKPTLDFIHWNEDGNPLMHCMNKLWLYFPFYDTKDKKFLFKVFVINTRRCIGFKLGLCDAPPVQQPYSLLGLANNCCITKTFGTGFPLFSI
jgi:tubulin epsilon